MHELWAVQDQMIALIQMAMFIENLLLLGGALLVTQFAVGPFSVDVQRAR
jgi:putative oxidoreductase